MNIEPPGKIVSIYFPILIAFLCESYIQSLQKILIIISVIFKKRNDISGY